MPNYSKFDRYAPQMIADLMHDFGFTDWQAAAFPGNAGAESAGFTDIIENGALAKGWAGGTGWFQWTGMKEGHRREEFEDWLARKGWKADSYQANYSYLYRELKGYDGTESKIVPRVKSAGSLDEATRRVCAEFLRPEVNNYAPRIEWAKRALQKYRENPPRPFVWPTDTKPAPAPVPVPKPVPTPAPSALKEGLTVFMNLIIAALPAILDRVLKEASANPAVPIHSEAPNAAAKAVTAEVMHEISQIPEVQHVTNTETHWYQQRSKWSAIIGTVVAISAPLISHFGLDGWITPENQETATMVLTTVGGLWAAYLAYRAGTAKKPLGA